MITNNIKIAWRNIRKNIGYTLINVTGLAVGIASSILLFSLIYFELSFDTFHSKKDNIFPVSYTHLSGDCSEGRSIIDEL